MKNIFVRLLFLLFLFSLPDLANASSSDNNADEELYSEFDESEIYNSFSEIDDLTAYLSTNDGITYSDMETTNSEMLTMVDNGAAMAYPLQESRFYFTRQTAYFMGCAFGMPGILAVAIINNGDTSVVNSSIWGLATSSFVGVLGIIAVYFFYIVPYSGLYN